MANETEARREMEQAEAALASAAHHLGRASEIMPGVLKDAADDLRGEVQFNRRRAGRFLNHMRRAKAPAYQSANKRG